jgi:hypothetical protein
MSKLRRIGVFAAVTFAAAAGIVFTTLPASAATSVTVTVHPGNGAALRDDFIGLSFEKNVLAGTPLSAGTLAQYMKTLGPGVVRFGGNFVDTTFWTSTGEKAPSWAVATVTPADLQRLGTLVQNSGWKVIYGVNLKHPDAKRAADEAAHAAQVLGSSLIGIEVGNEPNYYSGYSPGQYFTDFQSYKKAINAAAPGVKLIGPSPGRVTAAVTWLNDFTSREQAAGVDIAALTTHYYPACARPTRSPSRRCCRPRTAAGSRPGLNCSPTTPPSSACPACSTRPTRCPARARTASATRTPRRCGRSTTS